MPAGKPYKFKRMTSAEFSAALDEFEIGVGKFCRLTGAGPQTVQKWLDGVEEPPHWVAMAFACWRVPQALPAARDEAEARLIDS